MGHHHREEGSSELRACREFIVELDHVLAACCAGDLEPRVHITEDSDHFPELTETRHRFNYFLDVVDAFVRESGASLTSAAHGQYLREFLEAGMPGVFRTGASTINEGRHAIEESAQTASTAETRRRSMAEQFEDRVVQLVDEMASTSDSVAAASGELGQAAGNVAEDVRRAHQSIADLSEASHRISSVTNLIDQIAARTRLLALNATIEAARVGEAGRGFAVVADEVKKLAGQTTEATQLVAEQLEAISLQSAEAVDMIGGVGQTVSTMTDTVGSMTARVSGDLDAKGLSESMDHLRDEVRDFLAEIRR